MAISIAINKQSLLFMDIKEARTLAEELKGLACKECTQGWVEKHDRLTNPINDICSCAEFGLISPQLQERLVNEVQEIIGN